MSYLALATSRFDEVVHFYGTQLGFPTVGGWDRPGGRAVVFDLRGLRLEVLDAGRERRPLDLPAPGDRLHVVVEVDDVEAVQRALAVPAPPPVTTRWGARLFEVRDPDGVAVCFLQWLPDAR